MAEHKSLSRAPDFMQFACALVCMSKKAIERSLFLTRKPKGRCKKLLSVFLQLPEFGGGDPTQVHGWRKAIRLVNPVMIKNLIK